MREIRPSGLAGGGAELNRLSLPRSDEINLAEKRDLGVGFGKL
jgi:hypothetical protein